MIIYTYVCSITYLIALNVCVCCTLAINTQYDAGRLEDIDRALNAEPPEFSFPVVGTDVPQRPK